MLGVELLPTMWAESFRQTNLPWCVTNKVMRQLQIADYPISRLVADMLDHSGLTPHEFLRHLGYSNEGNGFRSLYGCLEQGLPTDFLVGSIARLYRPDSEIWNAALVDVRKRQERA